MNKVLAAEMFKLKHSKILWLIWIGALLSPILYTISSLVSGDQQTWQVWFQQNLTIFVMFGCPIFSIITGYIIAREYQNNTINNVFTYPYSRLQFLIGKIIVAVIMIISTCNLAVVGTTLSGLLVINEGLSVSDFLPCLISHAVVAGLYFSLIPLWMFTCILGKSYLPAILIGVAMITAPGPIGGNAAYPKIIQFIQRFAGIGEPVNIWPILSIVGSLFIIFLLMASLLYTKSDVHSGS